MGDVYPQLNYKDINPTDERIVVAADYIQQHYTQEFTNEDLAKVCNMSVSRLYFHFKETFGISPTEYKNTLLINQAKVMLLDDSNMKIQTICDDLGFSSADYFRRLFKKHTGKTPREFQKEEHYACSYNGL